MSAIRGGRAERRPKAALVFNVLSVLASIVMVMGLARVVSLLSNEHEQTLLYGELYGEFFDDYTGMVAIAHNSGNLLPTTRQAVRFQAGVIEIDVRMFRGELRASHGAPVPYIGEYVSGAPSLGSVWPAASGASAIKIDLKDNSSVLLNKLFAFLRSREDPEIQVIIASRSHETLERVREDYPAALRFLSIASESRLAQLMTDASLISLIDGVTARVGALNDESARWLEENEITTYAWVVNDLATLNQMQSWGVDGVITDNLAIIELLAPQVAEEDS